MPDSNFHDSLGWFEGVVIILFLNIEEMDSILPLQHHECGETLSYNGLMQMESIIFQRGFKSGAFLVTHWI